MERPLPQARAWPGLNLHDSPCPTAQLQHMHAQLEIARAEDEVRIAADDKHGVIGEDDGAVASACRWRRAPDLGLLPAHRRHLAGAVLARPGAGVQHVHVGEEAVAREPSRAGEANDAPRGLVQRGAVATSRSKRARVWQHTAPAQEPQIEPMHVAIVMKLRLTRDHALDLAAADDVQGVTHHGARV